MVEKQCPLCKRFFEGKTYVIGSHPECCKKCYDEKRRTNFTKHDPDAQRYTRYNLTLSFIGILASLAIVAGIILAICGDFWYWPILIVGGVLIISTTTFISFKVDKKLNAILKKQFPDMEFDYELPKAWEKII